MKLGESKKDGKNTQSYGTVCGCTRSEYEAAPDDPFRLPFEENQRTERTGCRSSNRSTCTTKRNPMHNLQSDSSGDGRNRLISDSEAALRLPKFENMDDNGDASRNLVTSKKPSTRKSVLFVGNLKPTTTSDELKMFIARCAAEAQCLVQVFNCTIFQKETTSSARIIVSSECANLISDRRFWPRSTYTRTWAFDKYKDTNGSDVQTGESQME